MKSSRLRLEQVADPENLREAFLAAAKGKATRVAVISFRADLQRELNQLRHEILSETLEVGECRAFTIHEPKISGHPC